MDSTFRDAAVLQQITTELNGAVSEEDKIVVINKTVLISQNKMVTRSHRFLKVVAFNTNGNGRQCYELSKQKHISAPMRSS
jgi:hypothetical protein